MKLFGKPRPVRLANASEILGTLGVSKTQRKRAGAAVQKIKGPKPGECCEVMKMVIAEEKPRARSGFCVPFAVWGRGGLTLNAKPPQITYRASGRAARTFFVNFCPWCGKAQ